MGKNLGTGDLVVSRHKVVSRNNIDNHARKKPFLNSLLFVTLVLSWGVTFLLYQYSNGLLGHYDSGRYQEIATAITGGGGPFKIPGDQWRGFFYPTILAITQLIGSSIGIPPQLAVFILQLGVYIVVCLYILREMRSFASEKMVFRAHIVLGANLFVSPYFSLTLTDSLYTSMALAMIFWAWTKLNESTKPKIWPGVLFFSLAVAIRPAAMWLLFPLLIAVVVLLYRGKIPLIREAILSVIALAPLAFQSAVNFRNFGVFSPLPVADLGGSQVKWGVENVKYATWTGPGSAANFYPSSSFIGPYDGSGVFWYLQNPIEAMRLIFTKLVGAFDFDYLVPYPNQAYELSWITSSLSFMVLLTSILVLIRHSMGLGVFSGLGPRWFPITVFISWAALTLLSALELRFTLPILIYLSLVSLWFPRDFSAMSRRGRTYVTVYFLAGLTILWSIAIFVRSLAISG
jgi:hypothetical protein